VGDADNFRLYHTPGFGWRGPFKFRHVPTNQKGAKTPNEIAAAGVLTSPKTFLRLFVPNSSTLPLTPPNDKSVAELLRSTIHIRMAAVDAPEVNNYEPLWDVGVSL
jgi:hypothetical protein